MPDDVFSDGSIQFGSQTVAVTPPAGGASTDYVLKDISYIEPSNRIVSKDAVGRAAKKVHVPQLRTGSATAQLATTGTARPPRFGSFALVPEGGGAALNFIIEETGAKFEQESEVMCSITFSEKLN